MQPVVRSTTAQWLAKARKETVATGPAAVGRKRGAAATSGRASAPTFPWPPKLWQCVCAIAIALALSIVAPRTRAATVLTGAAATGAFSEAEGASPSQPPTEPAIIAAGGAGEEEQVAVRSEVAGDAPLAGAGASLPLPPPGFNTYDGGWVQFSFPPAQRHLVQPLIAEADEFRSELQELFGYPVLQQADARQRGQRSTAVSVRVARTPGEMAAFAPPGAPFPEGAAGVAYSSLGLVLLTIEPPHPAAAHDLSEVFRHELAHVALWDALRGRRVPRWLNEGFAIHLSGEGVLRRMQSLSVASLSGNLLPLSDLAQSFPAGEVEVQTAYAQSADVVRHLLRREDLDRFIRMLRRIRSGDTFEAAMAEVYGLMPYGIGASSIEDEWRREVAKRYGFLPALFSSGMMWVGAVGLVVLAYRRRRKRDQVTLDRWAIEEAAEDDALARVAQDPARMHIVLAPREPGQPTLPALQRGNLDIDVPKVEHEGSWHTLH